MVGTIFEDSPIPLTKWLPAVWLLSANRNGIPSCEAARGLGVTQKTAWFMVHRIRVAMQAESFVRLSGEVEADEPYIAPTGSFRNRREPRAKKSRGPSYGKTAIMGTRERGVAAMAGDNNRPGNNFS